MLDIYFGLLSFCFFKQKTAYEMRISDWSSDVCSSDLLHGGVVGALLVSASIVHLVWSAETDTIPKIIDLSVDYLRSARPVETFASAIITKRSEERSVGKECVSTCRYRWSPYH